jgi:hypothetical protein
MPRSLFTRCASPSELGSEDRPRQRRLLDRVADGWPVSRRLRSNRSSYAASTKQTVRKGGFQCAGHVPCHLSWKSSGDLECMPVFYY